MRVILFIGILATGCAAVHSAILYPLDEALQDALSGTWEHLGTGPCHGNARALACTYRNARVLVVNVYCTTKEAQAFRLDVYSPTRGVVSIYAEAKVPVGTVRRRDYFSFNAEAQPPPRPEAGLPPLTLTMSFAERHRYDHRRYTRFLPACYGGVELRRPQGGCLGELAPRAAQWVERNRTFLAHPPADWYHIVRELRALARKHARTPAGRISRGAAQYRTASSASSAATVGCSR